MKRLLKRIIDYFFRPIPEYQPPEGYIDVTDMPDMVKLCQGMKGDYDWKPKKLYMHKDMFWRWKGHTSND